MSIHAQDPDWDDHYATAPDEHPPPGPASAGSSPDKPGPHPSAPLFATLEAWVSDYLAPMITVETSQGMRWCAQWWRHAEAIARLEALWRAWEALRIAEDPLAMSVWWRDHADHHLAVLMEGDRSPFRQCTAQQHRDDLPPLPVVPAPPGWFGSPGS